MLHIAQRITTLFNCAYPDIKVSHQAQWNYFNGKKADCYLDLLWRVESRGQYFNLAFTEFKKPGSIKVEEWEAGIGRNKKIKKNFQSQQLTRYHHAIKKTRSQLTDLETTIVIKVTCNPDTLTKAPTRQRIATTATADVWIARNGTSLQGDSLLRSTIGFIWEALKEDGWIQ
jgi:hypothetical protein